MPRRLFGLEKKYSLIAEENLNNSARELNSYITSLSPEQFENCHRWIGYFVQEIAEKINKIRISQYAASFSTSDEINGYRISQFGFYLDYHGASRHSYFVLDQVPFGESSELEGKYKLAGKVLILLWYKVIINLFRSEFSNKTNLSICNYTNYTNIKYMYYVFLGDVTVQNTKEIPTQLNLRPIADYFFQLEVSTLLAMEERIDSLLIKYISSEDFWRQGIFGGSSSKQVLQQLGVSADEIKRLLAR